MCTKAEDDQNGTKVNYDPDSSALPSNSATGSSTDPSESDMLADSIQSNTTTTTSDVEVGSNINGTINSTRRKSHKRSQVCDYVEEGKPQCKQRAIVSFKYCIRHILSDPDAPYKRCSFMIKNKTQCTNAIKVELNNIYCSTHLIKRGEKEPKRKKNNGSVNNEKESEIDPASTSTTLDETLDSSFESQHPEKNIGDGLSVGYNTKPNTVMPETRFASDIVTRSIVQRPVSTNSSSDDFRYSSVYYDRIATSEIQPSMISKTQSGNRLNGVSEHNTNPSMKIRHNSIDHIMKGGRLAHSSDRPEVLNPVKTVLVSQKKSPLNFIDCEAAPVFYLPKNVYVDDELSDVEKLRRDYLNDGEKKSRKSKIIKLRQKRQRVQTKGPFRSIPSVESMCHLMEDHDFDSTDLFPLGLEPSDDEASSDDEIGLNYLPELYINPLNVHSCRLELYLMKKRLRRESEKLQKNAKLSMAIMQAAKCFPDTVGAAFRVRGMAKRRRNLNGLSSSLQRCFYVDRNSHRRCVSIVVPRASMCIEHIGYSVEQRVFSFCSTPCCGRPVLKLNLFTSNGMCEEHFLASKGGVCHQSINKLSVPFATNLGHSNNVNVNKSRTIGRNITNGLPLVNGPRQVDNHYDAAEFGTETHLINLDDFNVTDVVDGDVSLSSVANELMFDNHELNDMLAQFPVDETQTNDQPAGDLDDSDGLLSVFPKEIKGAVEDAELNMGHSWADISEFLRSEGYSAESPPCTQSSHETEFTNA